MSASTTSNEKIVREVEPWSRWSILAFGQVLSVLMSVMWGSQSTLFLKCQWSSPAFSCCWAYFLLSFFLIPLAVKGRAIRKSASKASTHRWFLSVIPIHASPWVYLGIAFLSFYGNYCFLLAVSYTTITSAALVDALSTPTAMILSYFFLRRRYARLHLIGATLCVTGVLLDMVVDVLSNHLYREQSGSSIQIKHMSVNSTSIADVNDGSEEYPHKLAGDLLSCLGALLFGTNDVLAEHAVRRLGGVTEYLGMVGFFGFLTALGQVAISERQIMADIFSGVNPTHCDVGVFVGLLVAYIIGQSSRKVGLAAFLTISDAALLQLSLLTSDFYTAMLSIVYFHIYPRSTYWLAMITVVIGIIVYEMAPSPRIAGPNRTGGMPEDCNASEEAVVKKV